jgi:hypothetical protein
MAITDEEVAMRRLASVQPCPLDSGGSASATTIARVSVRRGSARIRLRITAATALILGLCAIVAVAAVQMRGSPGPSREPLAVLGHHVHDRRLTGGRPPRALWGRLVL